MLSHFSLHQKPNGFIRCEWFDGTSLKWKDFNKDMLEFVNR